MFYLIVQWTIRFLLIVILSSTILQSTNHSFQISLGFFCIYCGRPDYAYSHLLPIESRSIVDCSQPYYIFCSYREAIGCMKYIKIFDYHIHIVRDCLRFTELPPDNLECHAEYPTRNFIPIREKRFCCNNTVFCNGTFSIVFRRQTRSLLLLVHLFLLLINSFAI